MTSFSLFFSFTGNSSRRHPGRLVNQINSLALLLAIACSALPGTALAADAKASKFYEDALVRYEKRDLDGAIIQLKNALQIDKNQLSVQMLLGKALLQNGDVASAEVALLEALRLGVNRAEVVIPLGQSFVAQGKQKLMLEGQNFAVAGLPQGVQVQLLLLRASASADLGDGRAALKAIEDARAIDPRSAAVWMAEVPVRIRGRQLPEAAAAAERAVSLAPNQAEAWYQKGSVQHVSGKLPAALAAYDQALKLDPDHVETHIARAGLLLDLTRFADAGKDLADLKRVAPNEPRAAYLRALLAERDNKPDESRAALKNLTALLDPVPIDYIRYRPQLLMLNGLAHYGLNEREKAKQYLEAFQKAQGNTPASKLLAQIHLGDGNADRAIEVLEIYLKAQPGDGQAMTVLGNALMSKGQHVRAASLMQQALQTKESPQFRTVLGMSLLRSGQVGDAMKELEIAYKGDPTQLQAAVSLVSIYMRTGQAAKAVDMAEKLIKLQPGNPEFHNMLGTARAQNGNAAGAKAAFEQSSALDAKLVAPQLNLARLDISAQSYDAATARLNVILKANEKNTEAMYELAAIAERKGQPAETQRWLEKASDLSGPRDTRWVLALSDFHLRNGRTGPALEAAKRASAKAPDDLPVLMTLAKTQLSTGDLIGAKSTLTNATRVADYNPTVQVQIAGMQIAANNLPGAAYSLDKALSTQPDFVPAMALMSEVELRQGEAAKAEARARSIVAQAPKRAIGYSLLGDVAMSRSQAPAALEAYRRAYDVEPSTNTMMRLFNVLAGKDDGKPALQLGEQWLKTHPRDVIVQKAMADTYSRVGNMAQARTFYDAALKTNPEDGQSLNNLANVHLRLKDFPAAVKTAELALTKVPGNPLVIDTLGWALLQSGQIDRALQLLRDARLRQPDNNEIRYHLAAALAQAGRKNEAKDELEAALKSGARFDGSAEATQLLADLKR